MASDALLADKYDPIDHLNAIFSQPATLSSAPAVAQSLQLYQQALESTISTKLAAQAISDAETVRRIHAAKAELSNLFRDVDSLRFRALETEQNITAMTADIQRLDNTKRNLTLSMTALKRLQMLTTAYEQLRSLGKSRQYRECAQLLQAVIELMAHFRSYRSIEQIAILGRKVAECQRELLEQVCEDFEAAFTKSEVQQKRGMLTEACLVMDAMGEGARSRLVMWYCNAMLREYRQIFKGNDEAGSLDNISRRYAWFNRMLKTHEYEHGPIFPSSWHVNETLANSFCVSTSEDFKNILQQSLRRPNGQTLDVDLLLSCLQQTLDFEHSLERRFANESRTSIDTLQSSDEKPKAFEQAISEAFEPYLSLWVDAQDRHLAALIPKYRLQPLRNPEEDFSPQSVIPSSMELFQSYRLTLAQCAKLSTGSRLLELSRTFAKYLDQYSQQILFYFLNDRPGPQSPSLEDIITILNTADYCYNTCTQLEEKIKSRIDEPYKANVDLQNQADTFMGIAGATVRALVRKVELSCEPSWREMRNIAWSKLENVGDQSSYVNELVQQITTSSSAVLHLLHKQQYARAFCDNLVESLTALYMAAIVQSRPISEVGAEQLLLDSYVVKKALTDLPTVAAQSSPSINNGKPLLSLPAYTKRVAITTAKLDTLLKTLQIRASPPEGLVTGYINLIGDRSETNFRKILELKGIPRRQEQARLVELFHAHSAHQTHLNASSTLLTPLQLGAVGPGTSSGPVSAAQSATNSATSTISAALPTMAAMTTPGLAAAAKFEAGAASFGNAILSATREGIDRFGSPLPGSMSSAASSSVTFGGNSTGPSRVSSPPTQTPSLGSGVGTGAGLWQQSGPGQNPGEAQLQVPNQGQVTNNLNDNLRNIGKFFRRDLGAFGRFGGAKQEEGK